MEKKRLKEASHGDEGTEADREASRSTRLRPSPRVQGGLPHAHPHRNGTGGTSEDNNFFVAGERRRASDCASAAESQVTSSVSAQIDEYQEPSEAAAGACPSSDKGQVNREVSVNLDSSCVVCGLVSCNCTLFYDTNDVSRENDEFADDSECPGDFEEHNSEPGRKACSAAFTEYMDCG